MICNESLLRVLALGGIVILLSALAPAQAPAAPLEGADALRAAIEDPAKSFPQQYPDGPRLLAQLEELVRRAQTAAALDETPLRAEFDRLRRKALLANPLVSGQPILFVVRKQYRPDHHNTETMFQTGEINTESFDGGGAIKAIEFAGGGRPDTNPLPKGEATAIGLHPSSLAPRPSSLAPDSSSVVVKTLLEVPAGVARDPEVSFDGTRIVFAMRRSRADDYHIYEMNADGSGLVQITFGSGITDIDPIYLPTGEIVFTSTREPKYCMCNRHIMGNLFKMEADGANIQQISHNTLHDGHPALLPDGRILYDRWEYVDRNFGNAQGVWTVNPDGTHPLVWYGNSTDSPGAVLDARPIPGTEQIIATLSSCHDRPWGALGILDRRFGVDGRPPVLRTWPAGAVSLVDRGNYDTFTRVQPKYEDPWPLSDKHFLCSRMTGQGEQMGIFLVDVFGNELLLHAESPGCFDPMPLGPRPRPPVIPPRVDLARGEGVFFVADVYQGTGMERIERGSVKRLRVVASPEKRTWTPPAWDGGTGQQAPGMNWDDFNNKRILGSVPVEPDGSAHFAVPADTFVYFQLLDAEGRMVQSMRSGTIVRPGETTGCVGCHEGRRTAVPARDGLPLAVRRPPCSLEPWYGPPRNFNYLAEVQPVLDRHCVRCHDFGPEAGKKLNLAGDLGLIFNTSYVELRGKGYVRVIGAGPPEVLPPKTWGSHASPLAKVLLEGHKDPEIDREVRLDREAIDRVLTWIDINAPYYPEYATAYPDNLFGRAPISMAQLHRLGQLVGLDLTARQHLAMVSFTRPELSPCLRRIPDKNDPRHGEAVAILRSGSEVLRKQPGADLPGFRLIAPAEIEREAKYQALHKARAAVREAIVRGERRYENAEGRGRRAVGGVQ